MTIPCVPASTDYAAALPRCDYARAVPTPPIRRQIMLANVADRKKEQQMMARTAAQKLRSLATDPGYRGWAFGFLVVALLAGLPIAVWLDLSNLADAALHRQAADLNSVITSVRGYYASNVVGRVLAS